MTEINLLPWREKRREQEKKLFTSMLLGSVVAAAFAVFLVNSYVSYLIDNQTARNIMLDKEIKVLDNQIKEIKSLKQVRQSLISRMSIIQNLQSTRTLMVHLFDELINVVPDGVFVYKLERKDDKITLWGYAEANTNISILMKKIETNPWVESPVLTQIKKMDDSTQAANNDFSLSFILTPPKKVGS